MRKANILRISCVSFIVFFLLTPTIKIPGFIGVRLDDFLAFSMLGYFILVRRYTRIDVKMPVRANLILFFSILLLASITWGLTYQLPTNILDLTKYIWLSKMLIIYLVFFNYFYFNVTASDSLKHIESRRDYMLNVIVTVATVSAVICIFQYFDPLGINKYYLPIIAPTQYTTLLGNYATPRVVGMIGNPNAQGYLMALSLVVCGFLLMKNVSRTLLLKFLLIATAMFMTLSRSALLCFLFGIAVVFFLYKKDKRFVFYKLLLLVLITLLIALLFIFLANNEVIYNLILWRFESLSNIMEDKSFLARFHGWIINIDYFFKSPILGVGPVPRGGDIFGASDNEWLYFLRAYGVVGILWLLIFFFSPLFLARKRGIVSERNYSNLALSIVLMTSLYMIPAAVVTSSSINSLFLVLLALKDKELWVLSNGK